MARSTVITTRRLRLRNWRTTDVERYHQHCNTDAVMAYLDGTSSKREVRHEVRWYQEHQARHGHTFWVVERKSDKALLGFCGIIRIWERESPLDGKLEIGWRIRADKWRRGYAYEAATGVVDWVEWELPSEWLFARIHKHNAASQGLAQKLGMRRARAMEARQVQLDPSLLVYRIKV